MPLKLPIFMDSQSTTPMDPRVLEAMLPYFTEKFGHPASRNHPFGWEAEAGVDKAREQIATLIGARDPKEVVFTSGGTESINLALKGVAEMYREKGNHILTTTIEQRASLDVCKRLERQGFEVTYLPVGREGLVDVETLRAAITDKTILISVMFANNEIGTIQPIAEIGKLAKERGIIFHTDATQAAGKVPVNVEAMGIDLLSATAHLLYGPKGVGCLYVRRKNIYDHRVIQRNYAGAQLFSSHELTLRRIHRKEIAFDADEHSLMGFHCAHEMTLCIAWKELPMNDVNVFAAVKNHALRFPISGTQGSSCALPA